MSGFDLDVAVVGSGPSGIAAATALSRAGVKNITVYERDCAVGGVPRYTNHASFGLLVFKRPITGPAFVERLLRRCPDVRFETNSTLTALRPGGEMEITTAAGQRTVRARHIVLATGAREAPRHARMVAGLRPQGITTTGALQQFIHPGNLRPFMRPVIVGTELVSFSALWTLRRAGITPVAMIETGPRITAYRPATWFARALGVPIYYKTRIADIEGIETVQQVSLLAQDGTSAKLACDGVIFSGCFLGENTIAIASHLQLSPDSRIPLVDQDWLTSDSAITAIGNAVHPADMGDQCYLEGLKAGSNIARLLAGVSQPNARQTLIRHDARVKMTTPNMLRPAEDGKTSFDLALHVNEPFYGKVRVRRGNRILYEKYRRCLPTRKIVLRNIRLQLKESENDLPVELALGDPSRK